MVPEKDSSVRDRLLMAAVELFTTRGYAATSVREIVERGGVTKPVLYYHFGSKEGLYLEILRDVQRQFDEAISVPLPAASARHRVRVLLEGIFTRFEANVSFVRFVNTVFWGPPQGAPAFDFDAMHLRLREIVRGLVVAGIASGELRPSDPNDVTLALMGVLSFSMDLQLIHPEWGTGREGFLRLLDIIYQGVVAAPAAVPQQERPA
jgi:AcrR family transcriptional regulator